MTAEEWAVTEVGNALTSATDSGGTLSVGELRETVGIGHDDLMDVLGTLREAGLAEEVTPGEWRQPDGEARAGESTEVTGEGATDAARAVLDRLDGKRERGQPAVEAPARLGAEVVLTAAVAQALGAEALGTLVMAGLGEASEAERAFVLRIEP